MITVLMSGGCSRAKYFTPLKTKKLKISCLDLELFIMMTYFFVFSIHITKSSFYSHWCTIHYVKFVIKSHFILDE